MRRLCLLFLGAAVFAAFGCDNSPGRPNPANKFVRPENVTAFIQLYNENCRACHGTDGKLGAGPPLNDAVFLAVVPDEVLLNTVAAGRKGTEMPAFLQKNGGTLTEAQVKILAAGLKSEWGKTPPTGEYPPYESTGKGDVGRGKELFAQACANCHGDDGRAKGHAINDGPYLRLSTDQVLRRFIITGRPDLGMPDCMVFGGKSRPDLKAPLTTADIDDLVALLASWRTQ